MAHIADLGRRIELVPIDPHFHEITIALYHRPPVPGAAHGFIVHSYSGRDGTAARTDFVAGAMRALGGMADAPPERPLGRHALRFPCGHFHATACKRIFLEACKLDPAAELAPRGLSIFDKKSERTVQVDSTGGGLYHVTAGEADEVGARRAAAVAAGLVKLAQMTPLDEPDRIAFDCGETHDPMVGLLLQRALNVRAILREEILKTSRGVLAAPSAQQA